MLADANISSENKSFGRGLNPRGGSRSVPLKNTSTSFSVTHCSSSVFAEPSAEIIIISDHVQIMAVDNRSRIGRARVLIVSCTDTVHKKGRSGVHVVQPGSTLTAPY